MTINSAMVIHFVADQKVSAKFYADVLNIEPVLNVPGMTEFELIDGTLLGLMPVEGIKRLLGAGLAPLTTANKSLRSELYLSVDSPAEYYERAIRAGAKPLSKLKMRDWGDEAAYTLDPDGHILAFARRASTTGDSLSS